MADNPYVNKVVLGNQTIMDLTQDSVEPSNLLEGETAHSRSGEPITGTAKQGHSILNKIGTLLTQRSKLKFGGMLRTTDDSTNDVTVVTDEAEEIEWSVWDAMTEAEQDAYSAGKKLDILHAPSVLDNKALKTDIATVESGSIASGATFTVGTNIQSTKVSEELDRGWSVVNIPSLAIKAFVSKREVIITLKGTTVSTSAIGNIISDVTAYGIPSAPDFFATKNNDNNVVGISGSALTLYASDLASYATGRCFASLYYPIV